MSELPGLRPAWVEVDLDAVRANTRALVEHAAPAALLAVVKADGYGHGAEQVARAALDAGASWLGVALVEEGMTLREQGIDARILVLSEPPPAAAGAVVAHGLTPTVYTAGGIEALAKAVVDAGSGTPLPVHLKVDTGMHRVGCTVDDAAGLVDLVASRPELELEAVCTHFAAADETDHPYTNEQIEKFEALLEALDAAGNRPRLVHAANSAGLLAHPRAHYDLVRVGIALYGVPPAPTLADRIPLRAVLSLRARVSHVKELPTGSRVSYGLRYELARAGRVCTVPIGYADGVPRNLGIAGGEVLIRGARMPIAGTVTMDQLMVDAGDVAVDVGDEVVLLGAQGRDEITAGEWADHLGTIAYEIVTGIGSRAAAIHDMSTRKRVLKTIGITAGVAAGAAGAVYGAQRALTRSLRHRPDPDAGRLGPLRFDEEHRFESHDGGSLYAISRGSGPTIVLSHGVTIDSRVWVKQFEALPARGLRVVAFDHRGHGQSVTGASGHSIDNLGADLRTVLERLDLRDVLLVGHSMGGLALQELVVHHPAVARARVRGIVLQSTFARTPLSSLSTRGPSARISGWLDLANLMRRPQLGTLIARMGFGRAPLASHVELARQMLAECDADTARDAIFPLLGVDFTRELSRIDLPTLVLGGTADILTPPAEARRLAEHIPGAHLVLLEHAGHMLMLERAAELDDLLVDFARQVGVLPAPEAASA